MLLLNTTLFSNAQDNAPNYSLLWTSLFQVNSLLPGFLLFRR